MVTQQLILFFLLILPLSAPARGGNEAPHANDSLPPRLFKITGGGGSRLSNLFRINPKSILPTMIKHGGLVLPREVEADLNALEKVCGCEVVSLDVYHRELEIYNFTVSLPDTHSNTTSDNHKPALRIGRLFLKWDSYLNPVIEFELEDVDILVEFFDVLFTQSNWKKLKDIGFPPTHMSASSQSSRTDFIKIAKFDLIGCIRVMLYSHPLQQNISDDLVFEFRNLKELFDKIKDKSEQSFQMTGRRGCTTDEVYHLVEEFFKSKLKKVISSTAMDVGRSLLLDKSGSLSDSQTISHTQKTAESAKQAFRKYTENVASLAGNTLQDKVGDTLKNWGLSSDQVNKFKKASKSAADAASSSFKTAQGKTKAFTRERFVKEEKSHNVDLVVDGENHLSRQATPTITNKDDVLNHEEKKTNWIKSSYKAVSDAAIAAVDLALDNDELPVANILPENEAKNISTVNTSGMKEEDVFYPPW